MYKSCILATLLVFLHTALQAQATGIKFKHAGLEPGRVYESVNDIEQDQNGFIWIATPDGLKRYDGYALESFRHKHNDTNSLSFNWVWDIQPLSNGNLLVGTREGLDIYLTKQNRFSRIKIPGAEHGMNINQVKTDLEGNIWLATWGDGVIVLDSTFRLINTYTTKTNPAISSDLVGRIVIEENSDYVWFGTWEGLGCLDIKENELINYTQQNRQISGNKIIALTLEPSGGVWYGTSTGGYGYLNASTNEKILHNVLPQGANVVTAITRDNKGLIWVGTYAHGLYVFNQKGKTIDHFSNDIRDPFCLQSNNVQSLFLDNQGSVWIGNKGLSIYQHHFNQFGHIRVSSDNGLPNRSVWAFEEDSEGNLYIGTELGFSIYNPKSGFVRNIIPDHTGKDFRIIYSMAYDKSGKIWLGTEKNSISYYDIKQNKIISLNPILANEDKPMQEDVNTLAIRNNILWLGTYQKGLFRYNIEYNSLTAFEDPRIHTVNWASSYQDKLGNLYLCSIGEGIYILNANDSLTMHLTHSPNQVNSISNNIIRCMLKSSSGAFWIGTSNGLNYYLPARDTTYRFYEKDGLANNNVCGILEDDQGNVWVSTFDGLSRISMPNFEFTNYGYSDGLQSNSFNVNAFFKSSSGELFFGGKNGATHFKASAIQPNIFRGKTNITSFKLQGSETNLYRFQNKIVLDHTQNFFAISYMLSDFVNPDKNSFKYQLSGIDLDWKITTASEINYTHVPPGNYLFRVKGINSDGTESVNLAQVEIIIRKPWYFSYPAMFFYLLMLLGAAFAGYTFFRRRNQLKNSLVAKEQEQKKLLEMDKLRSDLLANISHEIRTPLSLILSPVDLLRNKIPEKQKNRLLNIISWNAQRLLFMVNQILDLSKADAQKLKLNISRVYLHKILHPIVSAFQSYALNEQRLFSCHLPDNPIVVLVDTDKFEKILVNLLTNAFKFSGSKGEVSLSIAIQKQSDSKQVKISVTDTGSGIAEEDIPNIFNRFYTSKANNHQGIGIGLALTKQLVEMHNGSIDVSSEPGKYTRFEVLLPVCAEDGIMPDSDEQDLKNNPILTALEPESGFESSEQIPTDKKDSTILIVEDDRELTEILVNLLQDRYNLILATNGNEALLKLEKASVDLILTDLVMPGMDGMEFIRALKDRTETINIPIIILSAILNDDEKLNAMQLGVEVFLDKPFNNQELLTQIKNILQLRARLKEAMQHAHLIDKSKSLQISGDNEQFIKQMEGIIQLNLTNPRFSIEFLAEEMNISRVQLHRKLKTILGITVSEFVRNYRLQLAAQYILIGKTRITEIAYEVGFSNPSYFTEQFKKRFGCLPSEYKNKHS